MKISAVEAIPVRIPRERDKAVGSAGSPTKLEEGAANYRWSSVFPVLYPVHFETALMKITLNTGLVGWGEAQAPLAPEVVCAIVDLLLNPVLLGEDFDGSLDRIEWRAPRIPVMANLTGRPHDGGDRIPHVMEMQLRSPVLWATRV